MAAPEIALTDAELQAERWLPVVGFEEAYQVSDLGRVRSLDRQRAYRCFGYEGVRLFPGRLLGQRLDRHGYLVVALSLPGAKLRLRKVHILVLEAFSRPHVSGEQTRHLDGTRDNNRLSNLAWGTATENSDDRNRHGTVPRGDLSGRSRLREVDIPLIRTMRNDGRTLKDIASRFGVSKGAISHVLARRVWRHVP